MQQNDAAVSNSAKMLSMCVQIGVDDGRLKEMTMSMVKRTEGVMLGWIS